MKALKKLTAIVLAVCMLIGMPLSIDVAATGAPNSAEFKLASGMIIPDSWGTTLNGDTQLSLYFTGGPITIDTSKVKAFVGIGSSSNGWYDGKQLNRVVGVYLTGTLSQADELLGGTSAGKKNPNNWIWTSDGAKVWAKADLKPEYQAYFDSDIDTLPEMKLLANLTGSDLMIRLAEIGGTTNDGVIEGIAEDTTKLVATTNKMNQGDGNLINSGGVDGAYAIVYDQADAPQMVGAYLDDTAKTLTVNFSANPAFGYRGNAYVWCGVRVLNNRGMIYCYNETDGFYTYKSNQNGLLSLSLKFEEVVGYNSQRNVYQLSDDQYNTIKDFQAKVAAHNATASAEDQLTVSFICEENQGSITNENNSSGQKIVEGRGDGHQNHYVDQIWVDGAGNNAPFMPNFTDIDGWVADIMAKEIVTLDDVKAQSVSINKVSAVERVGSSDRVVVEFSEAVENLTVDSYVRVFDSTGKLMTHDTATGKLTENGTTGYLQWKVTGWTKASADGTVWIADLNSEFECDTYDEIASYVSGLTNADGTPASGLSIKLSLVDKAKFKVRNNHLVDAVTAVADPSKKLFADNTQDAGEDRATCAFTDALEIVDVEIYADEYAIITFSEDIDMAAAIASVGNPNRIWLGAHKNPANGDDPVTATAGGTDHIHTELVNARQFGNANNKLLFDLSNKWSEIKEKITAYESANGATSVCVRIEGGGAAASAAVSGFTSADGTLKLYRSNPNISWGGRLMIATELVPAVTVTNVKADTDKNALIVTFSEPVKYNAQSVTLKRSDNTTYEAKRTTVALQRFKTADMTLDMDKLYQVNATGYTASDMDGTAVTDEYSSYWTFTFDEGVVETAVNYYATGNTAYSDEIGYGFGLFEAQAGLMTDPSMALPLTTYLEDFATAPDANGSSKYLKASSTSNGVRFFKAVTSTSGEAPTLITATEWKMTDHQTIQITFSEPVMVGSGGWNSIRVTENNNLVGPDNAAYQLPGTMTAVDPDNEGYSAVWNFKVASEASIVQFAQNKFFNDNYSVTDGISLCLSFQSNTGMAGDGLTNHITGKKGNALVASPYYRGADGTYLNIGNDPMLFTDSIIQKVELIGETDALVTVTPIQSYGGTKSWRIIDGATGLTKVIDGTEAVWKVYNWTNYMNGNSQMIASDMYENLGVKTFTGIQTLMDMDAGDKLVFAFSDTRINGVIDDFYLSRTGGGFKIQKAHFSTATEDVAYYEIDTTVTRESLTITNISTYDRVTQPYAYQDVYYIFDFSHELSADSLSKLRNGEIAVWISVKAKGENTFWYSDDGQNYYKTGSKAWGTQITATNFNYYGNAKDKLVAAIGGGALNNIIERVKQVNTALGYEAAELSVRFEASGLNGLAGVNTKMTAADSNVLPMVLDNVWGGGGRTYYSCLQEGDIIKIGSIKVIDANTMEVNFVDANGNPIPVTKSGYHTGSVYTAIRLTKDGMLAWSNKAVVSTTQTGTPLQFTGAIATKDGSAADDTWVFTTSDVSLIDLMQAMNDENGYLRKNGLDMALAFEGGTVNGEMSDFVDNFTSLDGKAVLQFTTDTNTAQANRYFYAYLPAANNWLTDAVTVPDTVKITKTELINNATLQVTFDQAVNITNEGWTGVRIVDGTNNLIRFDSDKTTPLGNIMTVGEKDAAGNTSGLAQQSMTFAKADADGKVWNLTLRAGLLGNYGFADMVDFVAGLPTSGENWNGSLKLAVVIEEKSGNVKNNGLNDRVVAADGCGAKLSNDQMGNSIGDGSCIEITEAMTAEFGEGVSVLSAKQINKNQILVKFSEAVTVDNPFIGIRLVDENDELIWSARDAAGYTIRGNYNQGKAIQWSCTAKEQTAADELLVTFAQDVSVILDGSNLPACLSPTSNPDYKFKLVIEETKPEESNEGGVSGFVCDVVSDTGKMLVSTSKHVAGHTSWDGNATVITNVITPATLITVSDAKITGENQVSFEWSHSVDLTKSGSYYAGFRYINEETGVLYGSDAEGWMQFSAYLNYSDSTMTKMTAHIMPNTKWGVFDLDDILNPTGALKEYMDAHPGKWVLRIEEMGSAGNGTIDSFAGKDGTTILADPFIGGWADGVYMDITGTPITGELSVTGVEIISDTNVKVTFSAPVAYKQVDGKDSKPYASLRLYNENNKLMFWNPYTEEYTTTEQMYDKDGNRIYKNQNGYTTEKEGYNAEGKWVPYAAQNNQAMQWSGTPNWGDDKHTSIVYTLAGGQQLPVQNLTDILNYDFTAYGEGWYIGFDIEENTPGMIASSGHVDNIVRADNTAIALDANFFPHSRDSVMVTMDNIKVSYTPYKITSKTEVISDTQIRISFSEPVVIEYNPFMAIRMIDKEGNLMWSGEENLSLPYQWSGKWEWEDDSHRAIIWSMTQTSLGASTIYDLANWKGVLQKYKDEGTWMFVIEELDHKNTDGTYKIQVGRFNNLVDNVASKDGTIHLTSTYSKGLDGILTKLDVSKLIGPELEILSAQAIDDQTIKLTFTEAVNISENVSMGVRYLSASGDSEVLTDGKVAYFKGDWEYADDTKKVIIWKLNSKSADNLTDIINYNGKFEWNKGARVAFVIMDAEEERGTPNSMRIKGIYDMVSGFRTLKANYATEDYPMSQLDIEVLYDIPAPEASGNEQLNEVVYVTNYIPFIIASCVIAVAGLVVAIILYKKRKKNEQ